MEVDNETNPSQMKSLLNGSLNVVDLNKKRKLEAELLDLPVSKHQFLSRSLSSKPPTFGSIPEVEGFTPCTFKGKGGNDCDVSETVSAKGSNSFAEDSGSTMSGHAETNYGTEGTKYILYDRSSSSSSHWGSGSQDSRYYSAGTTVASRGVKKEELLSPGGEPEPADLQLAENLEESLLEYGSHIDYIYSGYGNYTMEQYQDKEIEEILNSDRANPNVYILSSGRWSVNPGNFYEFENTYMCIDQRLMIIHIM
ncbi:hypothetical protein PTKIN_Ptkin06aG0022700 [Pterospermum kingtungense]